MFVGKAADYPIEETFRYSTLAACQGLLRSLLLSITVAYYKNLQLTVVKSFITLALILMNKNAIFNSAERLNY
jgi:hypothetical protein